MKKLVITIERTESQVSIFSLEPMILVTRDTVVDGCKVTDQEMLALFGAALEAVHEGRRTAAENIRALRRTSGLTLTDAEIVEVTRSGRR